MKFVCIADDVIEERDEPGLRVRVPRPVQIGDVVTVIFNADSTDPNGNPRKELRIYTLQPDPTKVAPRYHIGSIQRGDDLAFELRDFDMFIYTAEKFQPFLKLRTLLSQPEIDVIEVFAEFDKAIFRQSKKDFLDVSQEEAERLYERASKCKARCFGTPYPEEADTAFRMAVRDLAAIIGLELESQAEEAA